MSQHFPLARQLSSNAGESTCVYCLCPIGGLERNIGDLRLGCDCLILYTCLVEYIRLALKTRQTTDYCDFASPGRELPW